MPAEPAAADVKVKKPVSLKKDNGVRGTRIPKRRLASSHDENLLRNRGAVARFVREPQRPTEFYQTREGIQ